jgi:hypothetical protein
MNILSKSESQFGAGPPQKRLKRASSSGSSGQLVRSASTGTADSLAMSRADSSSAPAGEDDEATLATEGTMRTASSWTENGAVMAAGLEEDADDTTGGMNDSSGSTDRIRKKLQHQLGVEAVLMLLKPADLEGTGLTAADDSVHRALESCEVRSKVDYIWYGCLKVSYFVRGAASALVLCNLQLHNVTQIMRDSLLPEDDRPSFGSDLLWAGTHPEAFPFNAACNTHYDTDLQRCAYALKPPVSTMGPATPPAGGACSQLVYNIRRSSPQLPALVIETVVGQIVNFLRHRTADVSSEDSPEYAAFVETLLTGIEQVAETLEFFAESVEGSQLSLKYSLNKMRHVFSRKKTTAADATSANVVQVNLRDRTIVGTEEGSAQDQGDGVDAAPLDESARVFALDMVTVFSEALTDFLDWMSTAAMKYTALPSPLSEHGDQVHLRGILHFSDTAEQRSLTEMNESLHST